MKLLLSVAVIALTINVAYAAPTCSGNGRSFEVCMAKQERINRALEVRNEHRAWMQKQINPVVEEQNKVDEIIRKRGKVDAAQVIAEVCRQYAIVDSRDRYGYIKSGHYSKLYGQCLRDNGINYE